MEEYLAFLTQLEKTFEEFKTEAVAGSKRKAASLRARKLSLKLRKDLQEFRTRSINNDQVLTEAKNDGE